MEVPLGGVFSIHQCHACFGAMFDREGLQRLLQWAIMRPEPLEASLKKLLTNVDSAWEAVTYIRCPDCAQHMQRKNYGGRSGVIIDTCAVHGTWLDGGELAKLFEWIQTGGTLSDCPLNEERARLAKESEKVRRESRALASDDADVFD